MATTDMPLGTTKKTESLEKLFEEATKLSKDTRGFVAEIAKITQGDKGLTKKLLEVFIKSSKVQEENLGLQKRFKNDFASMIKYLKVLDSDPQYKGEQKDINKQAGRDIRKHQDKNLLGSIFDLIAKDKNYLQAFSSRHQDLSGSAKKNNLAIEEQLKEGYSGLSRQSEQRAYERFKGPDLPLDLPEEDNEGGSKGGSKHRRAGKNRGGSSFVIEKYGSGKIKPTEGEVAKLPFLISGPALLLHSDLHLMSDILQKMSNTAEWELTKGNGKGAIGDIIDSVLGKGILAKIVPILAAIASTALPIIGIIAVTAGIVLLLKQLGLENFKKREGILDNIDTLIKS
jgi:hypothetical protein